MERKNDKSEQCVETGSGVPVLKPGIGTRIKYAAERVGTRKYAATAAGVSEDMLYRYIREKGSPSFSAMVGLAREAKVRLEWIATGEGAPDQGAQEPQRPSEAANGRESGIPVMTEMDGYEEVFDKEEVLPLPPERQEEHTFCYIKQRLTDIALNQELTQSVRARADLMLDLVYEDAAASKRRGQARRDMGGRLRQSREIVTDICKELGYSPPEAVLHHLQTLAFTGVGTEHLLPLISALASEQQK